VCRWCTRTFSGRGKREDRRLGAFLRDPLGRAALAGRSSRGGGLKLCFDWAALMLFRFFLVFFFYFLSGFDVAAVTFRLVASFDFLEHVDAARGGWARVRTFGGRRTLQWLLLSFVCFFVFLCVVCL